METDCIPAAVRKQPARREIRIGNGVLYVIPAAGRNQHDLGIRNIVRFNCRCSPVFGSEEVTEGEIIDRFGTGILYVDTRDGDVIVPHSLFQGVNLHRDRCMGNDGKGRNKQ